MGVRFGRRQYFADGEGEGEGEGEAAVVWERFVGD